MVLVAAGDLAEGDVAAFRRLAVLGRYRLEELLRLARTPRETGRVPVQDDS